MMIFYQTLAGERKIKKEKIKINKKTEKKRKKELRKITEKINKIQERRGIKS